MHVTDSSRVRVPIQMCCLAKRPSRMWKEGGGSSGTHLHLRLNSTTLQTLRHAPPTAACPLRQVAAGSSTLRHERTTKAVGSRRQARLVGADGTKRTHAWKSFDGAGGMCTSSVARNSWTGCAERSRRPDTERGTPTDTQQVTQTLSPPVRAKTVPGNIGTATPADGAASGEVPASHWTLSSSRPNMPRPTF